MATLQSRASVTTTSGRRYMAQLCSHFSHKLTAAWDDKGGCIEFPFGACRLKALDQSLDLEVQAASDDDLGRMEQVIARHLERFAFREPLAIAWSRA
jgi:hypothetical protein